MKKNIFIFLLLATSVLLLSVNQAFTEEPVEKKLSEQDITFGNSELGIRIPTGQGNVREDYSDYSGNQGHVDEQQKIIIENTEGAVDTSIEERETDFDFIRRLPEEEGIDYYYQRDEDDDTGESIENRDRPLIKENVDIKKSDSKDKQMP